MTEQQAVEDLQFVAHIHAENGLPTIELFGADHDALWQDFSIDIEVCVDRTADYLNWRIFKHPAADYRAPGAYRAGNLVAEVVWSIEEPHGGVIVYVMELLQRAGEVAAGLSSSCIRRVIAAKGSCPS